MQTNIELASASGRAIRLPIAARREGVTVAAERPARPATLYAVMSELKRAERWETMVWIGIAIAALVLLVLSFSFGMREIQNQPNAARWGHRALPSGKKFVADAVDGLEMFGRVPVVAKFFSQLNDDLVEGPRCAEVIVTPDVVEQAVTRKNFAGMSGKELKQLKLFCGKFLDRFAAAQLESFRVDCGAADMEDIVPVLFGGGSCAGTAEECVDSCKEFADAEGLGDVVISAEVQSDDFVDLLTFSSQHQDGRRIFFGAELFAYVVPTRAGEHDVQDDDGRVALGYSIDGFIATVADGHVKAVPFHDFFESEQDMRVIFDDENSGFHRVIHADFLSQAGHNGSRSVKQLPPLSRGSYTTSPPWARAI
jgi:hypothetical protein